MFKPNYSNCVNCQKSALIVVKKGYCQRCNKELKDSKKKAEGKYKAPKQYVKKKVGTLELFQEIWNERPHVCQVTGETIKEFDLRVFSHVVPKSLSKKLALDKENVWIVTPATHFLWEFGDRNLPIFEKKRAEFERLKQKDLKLNKLNISFLQNK